MCGNVEVKQGSRILPESVRQYPNLYHSLAQGYVDKQFGPFENGYKQLLL